MHHSATSVHEAEALKAIVDVTCRTARAGEFPATEASFSLKIPITTFSELALMPDMGSS